jgi:hypothetical protein
MPFLKPKLAYSMPFRFQSMENMKVTLKLMNHILQNDAMNLVQFRVLLLKLRQHIIFESLVLQTVVIDGTALIKATEKFLFNTFARIQPKT